MACGKTHLARALEGEFGFAQTLIVDYRHKWKSLESIVLKGVNAATKVIIITGCEVALPIDMERRVTRIRLQSR